MRVAQHDFEDEQGEELTLNPDLQYEVVWTGVGIGLDDETPVFCHRVRLMPKQFLVEEDEHGDPTVAVVDLDNPTGEGETS